MKKIIFILLATASFSLFSEKSIAQIDCSSAACMRLSLDITYQVEFKFIPPAGMGSNMFYDGIGGKIKMDGGPIIRLWDWNCNNGGTIIFFDPLNPTLVPIDAGKDGRMNGSWINIQNITPINGGRYIGDVYINTCF